MEGFVTAPSGITAHHVALRRLICDHRRSGERIDRCNFQRNRYERLRGGHSRRIYSDSLRWFFRSADLSEVEFIQGTVNTGLGEGISFLLLSSPIPGGCGPSCYFPNTVEDQFV